MTPSRTPRPTARPGWRGLAGGIAVLTAAAVLCGCAPSAPDSAPAQVPAQAQARPVAAAVALAATSTAVLTVTSVTVHATASVGGTTAVVDGTVALTGTPRADLTVTSAGRAPAHVLVVGTTAYVQQADLSRLVGKPWVAVDLAALAARGGARSGSGLQALVDRVRALGPGGAVQLAVASGRLTLVGADTVDGRGASHYRGTLTPGSATGARLPAAARERVRATLTRLGITTVVVDLWVGAGSLPVRVTATSGSTAGRASLSVDYTAYDRPVAVSAPPAAQTAPAGALAGLLGSLLH